MVELAFFPLERRLSNKTFRRKLGENEIFFSFQLHNCHYLCKAFRMKELRNIYLESVIFRRRLSLKNEIAAQ